MKTLLLKILLILLWSCTMAIVWFHPMAETLSWVTLAGYFMFTHIVVFVFSYQAHLAIRSYKDQIDSIEPDKKELLNVLDVLNNERHALESIFGIVEQYTEETKALIDAGSILNMPAIMELQNKKFAAVKEILSEVYGEANLPDRKKIIDKFCGR